MAKMAICEKCGTTGKGRTVAPGSFLIEVVLWVAFCVPGLIYSIWRITSAKRVCTTCQGELVPLDTPRGQLLQRHYQGLLPR